MWILLFRKMNTTKIEEIVNLKKIYLHTSVDILSDALSKCKKETL